FAEVLMPITESKSATEKNQILLFLIVLILLSIFPILNKERMILCIYQTRFGLWSKLAYNPIFSGNFFDAIC
ncbi:hypothetical protein N8823_07175, partial [Candidatus Pseudothioglobus singularis]|nr:hypothetical protein [Candidatus Pseudothioglobus singularis]